MNYGKCVHEFGVNLNNYYTSGKKKKKLAGQLSILT
jgi:hypothetical protein